MGELVPRRQNEAGAGHRESPGAVRATHRGNRIESDCCHQGTATHGTLCWEPAETYLAFPSGVSVGSWAGGVLWGAGWFFTELTQTFWGWQEVTGSEGSAAPAHCLHPLPLRTAASCM